MNAPLPINAPTANAPLPQCCNPQAFTLLAQQVREINSPDALLMGAIAISMHQMEEVDPAGVECTLSRLAQRVRCRVRSSQPQAMLAHLHDVLFEEEGFAGNSDDYYSPSNSYLPAVLETRRGLPYKNIADRLGVRTFGVGLPGHFLVAVEQENQQPMLIDPYSGGRALTLDEARDRMRELLGPDTEALPALAEWTDDLLQPASTRHWLTRILQNLLHVFGTTNNYAEMAAILEMEMLLWPGQGHLQRDLALVLARIGLSRPASVWLNEYLKNNPDDPQRTDLKQLLDVLNA